MGALLPDKEARDCIAALQNRYGWEFVPRAGGVAHVAGGMRCGFGRGGCQLSVLSASINAAWVFFLSRDSSLGRKRLFAPLRSLGGAPEDAVDVSRETVRLWSTGSRRGHFPDRFAHVGSSQLRAWSEVYLWARDNGYELEDRGVPLPLSLLERTNGKLAGSEMTLAP